MTTGDIYAVIWVDRLVGQLTLKRHSATHAISTAQYMIEHGKDKIDNVRAVYLPANKDELIDLL